MVWGENGTSRELSGTSDICEVPDMSGKVFNQFLYHKINSGNANAVGRFNSNSNSVYAARYSQDGATDATLTSRSSLETNFVNDEEFIVMDVISVSGKEKLVMTNITQHIASGSGTAPGRVELAQKFVPSPDAEITEVNFTNTDTGDLGAGTTLVALGTNQDE